VRFSSFDKNPFPREARLPRQRLEDLQKRPDLGPDALARPLAIQRARLATRPLSSAARGL
jgi:hypothetical protein